MYDQEIVFEDRADAGRRLARLLDPYRNERPLVLGLPQGGVVVAAEVARALGAPLEVLVVEKLGRPFCPECVVGAIAPSGVALIQPNHGWSGAEVQRLLAWAAAELERRARRYRGAAGLPDVTGRTVLLVDDGVATGLTARTAIAALRVQRPKHLVFAAPVAASGPAGHLRALADDFVCLATPAEFFAVGQGYLRFDAVSDAHVLSLLREALLNRPVHTSCSVSEGAGPFKLPVEHPRMKRLRAEHQHRRAAELSAPSTHGNASSDALRNSP